MRSPRTRGLCVIAQALIVSGCARGASHAPPAANDPAPRTVAVVAGRVAPSITLSGIIAPFQNVTISSSLQEPADAVFVHEGDAVSSGQTLAQLDTADLQANYDAAIRNAEDAGSRVAQVRDQGSLTIEQSQADMVSAQSQLAQAQQKSDLAAVTLRRDRQLYAQGFLARQTLDNDSTQYQTDQQGVVSARASLQTAQASVRINGNGSQGLQQENVVSARAAAASARAQAEQIAVQIRKASVLSPIDGIVINRNINPGQYPGSSAIFTVQQVNVVYAMLNASSDQIFALRAGTPADVTVGSLGATHLHGVVEAVLGQAQPGATNFVVKVRIPNGNRRLQSGMVVTASMTLPPVSGPMIPAAAFLDAAHDAVRMQGAHGNISVIPVREVAGDRANAIVAGLPPGARVVVTTQ